MNIYIGADHNGFEYKQKIIQFLKKSSYEVIDSGDSVLDINDDFPQFASKVITQMRIDSDPDVRGILLCGSGQGMCMAANRFKGIRASLCWNISEARAARNDDNSNVLCLAVRSTPYKEMEHIIATWLRTPFAEATRYKRRLIELDNLG